MTIEEIDARLAVHGLILAQSLSVSLCLLPPRVREEVRESALIEVEDRFHRFKSAAAQRASLEEAEIIWQCAIDSAAAYNAG